MIIFIMAVCSRVLLLLGYFSMDIFIVNTKINVVKWQTFICKLTVLNVNKSKRWPIRYMLNVNELHTHLNNLSVKMGR